MTRTTRGGRSWVGMPAGTPSGRRQTSAASMMRSISAIDDEVSRWRTACQPRARAATTLASTSSRKRTSPASTPSRRGHDLVRRRVGLGEPHLVAVDDVVGDVLEAVEPLALARAGTGVRQDRGEPRGTLAGEPVEQLAVQRADVPAPEVVQERVDLPVVQGERALPLRTDLLLGHLADHRVARQPGEAADDRARREAEAALGGRGEDVVVDDLQHSPDVEDHRTDRHAPTLGTLGPRPAPAGPGRLTRRPGPAPVPGRSGPATGRRRTRPGRPARRACPDSTTRPASRTQIRWACRTVERRWATTIAVRRAVARRSERWIAASVSLSTALVASSRTSTAGSRSSARARASRCRWPPDRVTPRSPTQVSRPSGSASMKSSAAAASAAARICSRVASGRP